MKIFVLLLVANAYCENVHLDWPDKYSLDATKISLISGIVENIKYWRTTKYSRLDYNNGAVKIFAFKPKYSKKHPFGVKYHVYPIRIKKHKNKSVCTSHNGKLADPVILDEILPDVSEFDFDRDYEIVDDAKILKFKSKISQTEFSNLWVTQDNATRTWIPIKLESIEYETDNKKTKHFIWYFDNFKLNFSSDIFKVCGYGCKDSVKILSEYDHVTSDSECDLENQNNIDLRFNAFKEKYNKNYENEEEELIRKRVFNENARRIKLHNRRNSNKYKLAINKFADMSHQELKRVKKPIPKRNMESGMIMFPYSEEALKKLSSTLPKEYDLRLEGLVTPVKGEQSTKDCESAWTFSATSAVEGALARSNGGRLLRLSNQALIDCAWEYGALGCVSGNVFAAYKWIMKYGLPTEEEYGPFLNSDDICRIDNMTAKYTIRGFTYVTPLSIDAMKVALINHGSLSTYMYTSYKFYAYSGGIMYDIECKDDEDHERDHAVTVVGYGEKDGEGYWIVKNSWGVDWGVDGYFFISMRDNNCGVATNATYVVI